jgi:hypothetical protein
MKILATAATVAFVFAPEAFAIDLACIQKTSSLTAFEPYKGQSWDVDGDDDVSKPLSISFRKIGEKEAELVGNAATTKLRLVHQEERRLDYFEQADGGAPIWWSFSLGTKESAKKFGGPDHPVVVNFKNNAFVSPTAFTFAYDCK